MSTRCEGCLLPGTCRTQGWKQTARYCSLQGGRRRKVKAVSTNQSVSVLALTRAHFKTRSAQLDHCALLSVGRT